MADETTQVVTDCDVLMNLLATGCAVEILDALSLVLLVTPTIGREAIYLESAEPDGQRELIDLASLEQASVLNKVVLCELEIDLVVELARIVDDGEAEVIAVALNRNVSMATDDRKARRIAAERDRFLLSTPEIFEQWALAMDIPSARLSDLLHLISRRSRYLPPTDHHLHGWWMGFLSPGIQ